MSKPAPQRDVLGVVDPEACGAGLDVAHRHSVDDNAPAPGEQAATLERQIAARVVDDRAPDLQRKDEGGGGHVC